MMYSNLLYVCLPTIQSSFPLSIHVYHFLFLSVYPSPSFFFSSSSPPFFSPLPQWAPLPWASPGPVPGLAAGELRARSGQSHVLRHREHGPEARPAVLPTGSLEQATDPGIQVQNVVCSSIAYYYQIWCPQQISHNQSACILCNLHNHGWGLLSINDFTCFKTESNLPLNV